jgi:peptidoglycan-N-acetylglucosamine deacetylase
MYLVKTPALIKSFFSDHIWDINTPEKEIYLTFDDGPIPVVTPWVLDILAKYSFSATFFCVGENVRKYPKILERISTEGHAIGNHTYNHMNGWVTGSDDYIQNMRLCDEFIDTKLFRPPYGKLKPFQSHQIREDKKIVMWDILSGDFDPNISAEKCIDNVISNYVPGSIIVFHDNVKSFDKLKIVLPAVFDHLIENDFVSSSLEILQPAESYC